MQDESTRDESCAKNISEIVAKEAQEKLDKSEHKDAKKDELLSQLEMGAISEEGGTVQKRRERKRVKIVSTPIGGGDMFSAGTEVFQPTSSIPRRRRRVKTMSTPLAGDMWGDTATVILGPGEVLVNILGQNNEKYAAKMKQETYDLLAAGGTPIMLEKVVDEKNFTEKYLDGFVRRQGRQRSVSNLSWDEKNQGNL